MKHVYTGLISALALMLVGGTLLLTGCASARHGSRSASQKSAIESVLAQRAELKGKSEGLGALSKQHMSELMAIDVQHCPADFRSAWFDYLIEVENLRGRVERVAIVAAGLGKSAGDLPSLLKMAAGNQALGQYLLGALDRVDQARAKLDRVAMNYGVMPKP